VCCHVVGPGVAVMAQAIEMVFSLAVTTVLFALIFKLQPDAEVHWRDVWVGGVVTALLFVVGKVAIGLSLGHGGVGSAYGAAGSLVRS
jgi:membrane protein